MQPKDKVSLDMVDLHLHFILHLDFNLDVEGAVVKRYIVCCVVIISTDQWLSEFLR